MDFYELFFSELIERLSGVSENNINKLKKAFQRFSLLLAIQVAVSLMLVMYSTGITIPLIFLALFLYNIYKFALLSNAINGFQTLIEACNQSSTVVFENTQTDCPDNVTASRQTFFQLKNRYYLTQEPTRALQEQTYVEYKRCFSIS